MPLENKTIETLILERVGAVAIQHHFDPRMIAAECEFNVDNFLQDPYLKLTLHLYGRKVRTVTEEKKETFPATMWDEFKLRWFPGWLLEFFPANYRSITTSVVHRHYHICPHIDLPKEDIHHMKFLAETPTHKLDVND